MKKFRKIIYLISIAVVFLDFLLNFFIIKIG